MRRAQKGKKKTSKASKAGKATATSAVEDAHSLSKWLSAMHAERCKGSATDSFAAVLLTGPAAAGKTSLLSQVVVHSLESELVPIFIRVQRLQTRLLEKPDAFAAAWNWVDAYLRLEHQAPVYRMLRQALTSRRALLLLDGLDEGGKARERIERHVAEVLAPQGHVLLATSRPAGLDEARFAGFQRLSLAPLKKEQQYEALRQRLGKKRAEELIPYMQRVPLDRETKQRVTANPLMLSMVASVFELRQGIGMPTTVAELYEIAADGMLNRGGATSVELRRLLQAIFFEAHMAEQRVINDEQLNEAVLALERPEELAAIQQLAGYNVGAKVRAEVEKLPKATRELLEEVRRRVVQDELPLLSLLQVEPLQLQSSHLSFQEYFTARAICDGARLKGKKPWEWSVWWANTITIGSEMNGFGQGLLRAAELEGAVLDLEGRITGDRQTVLRAIGLFLDQFTELR